MPRIPHPGGWSVRRAAACLAFPAADGTAPRGGVHPGEVRDFRIPVWQSQGVSGALELHVQVVAVMRLDNLFKLALLSGQFIEVRIRFSVFGIHFIQTFQCVNDVRNRLFNGFTNGVFRIELRLLRQVANFDARLRTGFTFDVCIDAGHDAQQGGLTGTVETQNTDFCAREEAQRDIFKNMTFRRDNFADTMHGINELSHVGLRLFYRDEKEYQPRSVAFFPS